MVIIEIKNANVASPPSCTEKELETSYTLTDEEEEQMCCAQRSLDSLHRAFTLKEELGRGLSSTVRRVVEKANGKEYAVKIIDISGERDTCKANIETLKSDTIREVSLLRMCAGHPNIIELHDFFETPTFLFLVFELCKQGELFDYLTQEVSLSEKRTRFFMHQLFDVVNYLHGKRIVHRDLKPENILMDDNMNIKVSDFGFATVLPETERLTELLGTPGYLAPEVLVQAMNEDNDGGYGLEVDIWACGVIMFTLLCGSPPFWHRKQMYMLRDIMAGNYSFSSPLWHDVSDTPKDLISKLLVTDPAKRLTAKQALMHPFFQRDIRWSVAGISQVHLMMLRPSLKSLKSYTPLVPEKVFQPRRVFKAAVLAVCFFFRLKLVHLHPPPVPVETVMDCPYKVKQFRRLIDACAFNMYAHWVKRGENQNRAALFEHHLRDDWTTVQIPTW
ncbi:phosphorylase b kinase gamma catalytic chain, skeletal muscle/heart isoform-like isoform X2 [Littorina saxatilis]|uniref:phosphorylase b kinase gamma catalytic chain, skeletal muscle/heart isoform-like isoform X2 n=1 Tax=Littorina saxatilis TaxID=31220 RepID=UPI0038B4A9FB